jgi:hypothetical protein
MVSDSEPIGQNNQRPDAERTADVQTRDGDPNVASTSGSSSPPPTEARHNTTRQKENTWWDKAKPYAEILGLLALIVYTGYTIKMYYANKRAADAAHDSAVAAQTAANVASDTLNNQKKNFQIEQRPYVVIDTDRPPDFVAQPVADRQVQVNATIRNIGKTPAFNVVWKIILRKYRGGPKTAEGIKKYVRFLTACFDYVRNQNVITEKQLSDADKRVEAEDDVAPNATVLQTTQDPITLSSEEISTIAKSDAVTLYLIGSVDYADSFGAKYKTEFCLYYWGNSLWHYCDSSNTIK